MFSVSLGLGMLRVGCTARDVPLSSLCCVGGCVSCLTALRMVRKDDSPQGVPAPQDTMLPSWRRLGLGKTHMPSGYL